MNSRSCSAMLTPMPIIAPRVRKEGITVSPCSNAAQQPIAIASCPLLGKVCAEIFPSCSQRDERVFEQPGHEHIVVEAPFESFVLIADFRYRNHIGAPIKAISRTIQLAPPETKYSDPGPQKKLPFSRPSASAPDGRALWRAPRRSE